MTSGKKALSTAMQLRCYGLLCMFTASVWGAVAGCTLVGPDYTRPELQVAEQWMNAGDPGVRSSPGDYRNWWSALQDPALDNLIRIACTQNVPLRVAGAQVFEARARLGIVIGEQFPQVQQATGIHTYTRLSERAPSAPQSSGGVDFDYKQIQVGAAASWEIDFWGKLRRAVESEDANFLAAIAAYDNALVSLTANVASAYVLIHTIEQRLRIAHDNVRLQKEPWVRQS